jgi:hypothetical protein
MSAQTDEHERRVSRLLADLRYLRADRNFQGTTYYATDFSEVHAYVTPRRDEHDVVTLGLIDDESRYAIALNRLFTAFAEKIYLLPPHVEELQLYAAHANRDAFHAINYQDEVRNVLRELSEDDRERLIRLRGQGSQNDEDVKFAATLVKERFARYCEQVGRYQLAWSGSASVLSQLEAMVRGGSLDLNLRIPGVVPHDLRSLIGKDEVEGIFQRIMKCSRRQAANTRQLSKLRDARALLWLRELNRHLFPHARVILVSRDTLLPLVAGELEQTQSFGWPDASTHVRGLQSIYLDLLSRAEGDTNVDCWLDATENLLRQFQYSLGHLEPHDVIRGDIMRRAARHWDEQANLRLSLLIRLDDRWLNNVDPEPRTSRPPAPDDPVALLTSLWDFVYSDRYHKFAHEQLAEAWNAVQEDSLYLVFVEQLNVELVDTIRSALSRHDQQRPGVIVRSRYSLLCKLTFSDRRLQRAFDRLRRLGNSLSEVQEVFREAISVTVDCEDRSEGFLFMALILAIQERWQDALRLAHQALLLATQAKAACAQFHYFISLAARKSAMLEQQRDRRLSLLEAAYAAADAAVRLEPEDPRFCKERGTAGLRYWITVGEKRLVGMPASQVVANPQWRPETWVEAREDLERALDAAEDDGLRMELMNNLAYMHLHEGEDGLSEAEDYLTRLRQIGEPFPLARDTIAVAQASRGYVEQKRTEVQDARRGIVTLLELGNLTESEELAFRHSLRWFDALLSEW